MRAIAVSTARIPLPLAFAIILLALLSLVLPPYSLFFMRLFPLLYSLYNVHYFGHPIPLHLHYLHSGVCVVASLREIVAFSAFCCLCVRRMNVCPPVDRSGADLTMCIPRLA